MPAAAVIPAPVAYINVAAVKKLVVGFLTDRSDPAFSFGGRLCVGTHLSSFLGKPYVLFTQSRLFCDPDLLL